VAQRAGLVVVVGDVLLDRDVTGRATRLTPDGAGPVVECDSDQRRPGGAALAALLAAQDGHDVVLVAGLADDRAAADLVGELTERMQVAALPAAGTTPEKIRIRSGEHTLLRLDRGGPCRPTGEVPSAARRAIESASAILVSDYGSGTTAAPRLRTLLGAAAGRTSIVWDPHPRGAAAVPGVRVLTPNLAEARLLGDRVRNAISADCRPAPSAGALGVEGLGRLLGRAWSATSTAVTLGPAGAILVLQDGYPLMVPAPEQVRGDTCGAGDRFASAVTGALSGGAVIHEAVQVGVHAATRYVADGGPASLQRRSSDEAGGPGHRDVDAVVARVRAAGGTVVATGGCFDILHAGHVRLLENARRLGDCLIVLLNSDRSVARLKGPGRPVMTQDDRVQVLRSLGAVDDVLVFDEDTPVDALRRLRPDIWVKGGDYALGELPEVPTVAAWGGRVVLVPYLDGRSTTRILATAAGEGP
jgi:D-beta-D-heptose 7-phosphate kinase/D-beta-D-heptose 1-phosphate adenosyltransferase